MEAGHLEKKGGNERKVMAVQKDENKHANTQCMHYYIYISINKKDLRTFLKKSINIYVKVFTFVMHGPVPHTRSHLPLFGEVFFC